MDMVTFLIYLNLIYLNFYDDNRLERRFSIIFFSRSSFYDEIRHRNGGCQLTKNPSLAKTIYCSIVNVIFIILFFVTIELETIIVAPNSY